MYALIPFPEISPEIFSITVFGFDFALRWYALAYIVGILLGYWLVLRVLKNEALWPNQSPIMTAKQVEDMLSWIILGVILGGRLGFVLFYQPAYYLAHPTEILFIWQGGMAFHGGLLGVVLAAYLFARAHNIPKLSLADFVVLGVPPGLLLGRISNFINAELWGRQTDLPWAVVFPGPFAQDCPGVEGPCGRHPSQLYEAGLEGLLLGLVMIWLVWRLRILLRPGFLCGVFFAGYGTARFLVEFVRQPDAQFVTPDNPVGLALHLNGVGLTMGQLLSLPMIVLGVWLMLQANRTATARA